MKGIKPNLNEEKEHTILFDRNIYLYNNVIFPKIILKIQCDSNLKSILELCCDLNANVNIFLCWFFLFSCHEKLMHKQGMSREKKLSGADKVGEWWRVDLTKPQEAGEVFWKLAQLLPCAVWIQAPGQAMGKGQTGLPLKAKLFASGSSIFS